jgi:hypothetical protein
LIFGQHFSASEGASLLSGKTAKTQMMKMGPLAQSFLFVCMDSRKCPIAQKWGDEFTANYCKVDRQHPRDLPPKNDRR